jgi:hypothetical protein
MNAAPLRIQLSRQRGWRMPANTVKVDRTTRWGNPYDVREYGHDLALHLFAYTARGWWCPSNVLGLDEAAAAALHDAHCRWVRRIGADPARAAREALRGRNLACWCSAPDPGGDDRCHAAILLELANG